MLLQYTLLTNNPLFTTGQLCRGDVEFIEGNAWDVLVAGRDRIHAGARLLNHPRYGNFYPNQQPYRSLLLQEDPKEKNLDLESLNLLEEAMVVWRSYKGSWALPGGVKAAVDNDYALIDRSLMEESLVRYGLWSGR